MRTCPDCDGVGFHEYEAGLIRLRCETCKGMGKVPDVSVKMKDDNGTGKKNRKRRRVKSKE